MYLRLEVLVLACIWGRGDVFIILAFDLGCFLLSHTGALLYDWSVAFIRALPYALEVIPLEHCYVCSNLQGGRLQERRNAEIKHASFEEEDINMSSLGGSTEGEGRCARACVFMHV